MKRHKSKALEEGCLCHKCIFRFQCFTQERIFSDPIFQGLFEALMAKGRSKEEALEEVTEEIKFRMGGSVYIDPCPQIQPYQPWITGGGLSDGISISDTYDVNGSPKIDITYTLNTGEEITWSADAGELN